jgi:glycosyltransferase involved in cell wall biosynthesis
MKKKIMIVASYADSLVNFRGDFIKAIPKNNFDVVACAPEDKKSVKLFLNKANVNFRTFPLDRRGLNPIKEMKSVLSLYQIIKIENPHIILLYTIKPILYGSIIAKLRKVKCISSMITGVGYTFYQKTFKQIMVGYFTKVLYRIALYQNNYIFFQNKDDEKLFTQKKLVNKRNKLIQINGSGVNLDYFYYSKPSIEPFTFLIISRLLIEKGIFEFIYAAKKIKNKFPKVNFEIIGFSDDGPSAISENEIKKWENMGVIKFLGFKKDVRKYIEKCSVYVLPSYREGTPRSVLEALSMGRPIITTDTPGCKETVIDNHNGFLVDLMSVESLENAMLKFIKNPSMCNKMGKKSRFFAEDKFDVKKVNRIILQKLKII